MGEQPPIDHNQLRAIIERFRQVYGEGQGNQQISYDPNWSDHYYELMKSEKTRLRSFTCRTGAWAANAISRSIKAEDLAKDGFFYLFEDRVQCAFCKVIIGEWEEGDDVRTEHTRFSEGETGKVCPFISGEDVGNEPLEEVGIGGPHQGPPRSPGRDPNAGYDVVGNQLLPGHPIAHQPVQMQGPDMRRERERLQSFQNRWPAHVHSVTPETLARDGFFYTRIPGLNANDSVRCVFCGVEVYGWEEGDEAHTEHVRAVEGANRECPFLLGQYCGNIPIEQEAGQQYHPPQNQGPPHPRPGSPGGNAGYDTVDRQSPNRRRNR